MSNKSRIIYYYQTFSGLSQLIEKPNNTVSHIHLSSIHFGVNPDGSPYIHLNNEPPDSSKFDNVWNELKQLSEKGVKIVLMVGGAGTAFTDLFANYDVYFPMLYNTIKKFNIICGIDLDIEEFVNIENVKMLIRDIKNLLGNNFSISMSPLAYSLSSNVAGMGGFIYKDLYNSPEGNLIEYFNGQFYGNYNLQTFEDCVNNGYPPNKIIMGMMSNINNFDDLLEQTILTIEKYPNMGGVYCWEWYNAPPFGEKDPSEWSNQMNTIIHSSPLSSFSKCIIS
jgi:hypothetical protein